MSIKVYDQQNLLKRAIDPRLPMLAPDTSVTRAIAAIDRAQASCILIVREEQSIGIFTERDIVRITAREIPLWKLPNT
jgi:CBS domain-containing protein